MIDLPYQDAKAGARRQDEIIDTLRDLGAERVGIMQDYKNNSLVCQFTLGERDVTVIVSIMGYAKAWLKANKWSPQRKVTEAAWRVRAEDQAKLSIWAVLADWVKSQATMIYIGALDFDTAFLAHIAAPDGRRLIEVIRDQKHNLLPPPEKGAGQ